MAKQDELAAPRKMAQALADWDVITQGHIPTAMSRYIAAAFLAALERVEELTARYEGPFVPVESAKEGDVLGYSQVVYAGRGKPLRQQFSPEELDDLADSGEVGN